MPRAICTICSLHIDYEMSEYASVYDRMIKHIREKHGSDFVDITGEKRRPGEKSQFQDFGCVDVKTGKLLPSHHRRVVRPNPEA